MKDLKAILFFFTLLTIFSCSKKSYQAHFHPYQNQNFHSESIKEQNPTLINTEFVQEDLKSTSEIGVENQKKSKRLVRLQKRLVKKIEKLSEFKTNNIESVNTINLRAKDDTVNEADLPVEPMGLASLILGIIGLPLFFLGGVGLIFSLAAIILGAMSMSKINNNPGKFRGKINAKLGFWFGLFPFLVFVLILFLIILLLFSGISFGGFTT